MGIILNNEPQKDITDRLRESDNALQNEAAQAILFLRIDVARLKEHKRCLFEEIERLRGALRLPPRVVVND